MYKINVYTFCSDQIFKVFMVNTEFYFVPRPMCSLLDRLFFSDVVRDQRRCELTVDVDEEGAEEVGEVCHLHLGNLPVLSKLNLHSHLELIE